MSPSSHLHHETSDVNIGGVGVFVVVLVVATTVVSMVVWGMYRYLGREASRPADVEFPLAADAMRRLPPEPRLQVDPREDLARLRQSEDAVLHSYAWIDRNAGIVRIPIDRAMTLTAEKGLPTR